MRILAFKKITDLSVFTSSENAGLINCENLYNVKMWQVLLGYKVLM